MKANILKVIGSAVLVLLILTVLYSSSYEVKQSEVSVIFQFGKFQRIENPGFHFKLPFGIEKNIDVPIHSIFKQEFGFRTLPANMAKASTTQKYKHESEMITSDKDTIYMKWFIQYKISDPIAWASNIKDAGGKIGDISNDTMKHIIKEKSYKYITTSKREVLEKLGRSRIQENLDKILLGAKLFDLKILDMKS